MTRSTSISDTTQYHPGSSTYKLYVSDFTRNMTFDLFFMGNRHTFPRSRGFSLRYVISDGKWSASEKYCLLYACTNNNDIRALHKEFLLETKLNVASYNVRFHLPLFRYAGSFVTLRYL